MIASIVLLATLPTFYAAREWIHIANSPACSAPSLFLVDSIVPVQYQADTERSCIWNPLLQTHEFYTYESTNGSTGSVTHTTGCSRGCNSTCVSNATLLPLNPANVTCGTPYFTLLTNQSATPSFDINMTIRFEDPKPSRYWFETFLEETTNCTGAIQWSRVHRVFDVCTPGATNSSSSFVVTSLEMTSGIFQFTNRFCSASNCTGDCSVGAMSILERQGCAIGMGSVDVGPFNFTTTPTTNPSNATATKTPTSSSSFPILSRSATVGIVAGAFVFLIIAAVLGVWLGGRRD